jgi:hypothetical protein
VCERETMMMMTTSFVSECYESINSIDFAINRNLISLSFFTTTSLSFSIYVWIK